MGAPKFRPLAYINTNVCLFLFFFIYVLLGRLTHNANCDALVLIDIFIFIYNSPFNPQPLRSLSVPVTCFPTG